VFFSLLNILYANILALPGRCQCRREYKDDHFGDSRLSACIEFTLNRTDVIEKRCAERRGYLQGTAPYRFSNAIPLERELEKRPPQERVVSVHEKNPKRIRLLHEWFQNSTANNITITWNTMKQSNLPAELRAATKSADDTA
jgi:hypothetical protein